MIKERREATRAFLISGVSARTMVMITGSAGFLAAGRLGFPGAGAVASKMRGYRPWGLAGKLFNDPGKADAVGKAAVFGDIVDSLVEIFQKHPAISARDRKRENRQVSMPGRVKGEMSSVLK